MIYGILLKSEDIMNIRKKMVKNEKNINKFNSKNYRIKEVMKKMFTRKEEYK